MRRTGRIRVVALALAAGALACATPRGDLVEPEAPPAPTPERSLASFANREPEFYYLAARELELQGREDDAIAALEQALALDPDAAVLDHKLAQLLARRGRLELAQEHAERAHQLDPDNTDVRHFLGTLYRIQRDAPAAEAVLRDDEGYPVDFEAGLLLFGIYTDRNQDAEALEVAQWLVDEDPRNLRGYFALSRAHQRAGRFDEAEFALEQAFEVEPGNLAVYSLLARSRRERDDREGEIEVLSEALATHPGHHRLLGDLVEAYLATGRDAEARGALREIESRHPRDLVARARLGYLELSAGNLDAAEEQFREVLAADSNRHEIYYFLGLTHRRRGDWDEAIAAFAAVPEGHERYAEARAQLAGVFEAQGDYSRALDEAERARTAAPSQRMDFFVASLTARSGDLDGAVALLTGLLEDNPGDEEVLYNLGVVYGDAQRTEEALVYMQEVLERNPNHPGALNYVGYTWAERGHQLDEAEEMIVRALEQRPDDGYITDSLGWVYYMRARPLLQAGEVDLGRQWLDRSIAELEKAAALTGGDPVISEHLGDAYLLLQERERALEFYEEAADLGPRGSEQPALLDKLQKLRQELSTQ